MYVSDILKINYKHAPSKLLISETCRRFHPHKFAQFLYLCENVSTINKDAIHYEKVEKRASCFIHQSEDIVLEIGKIRRIRFNRVISDHEDEPFWNETMKPSIHEHDKTVTDMINDILNHKSLTKSSEDLMQRICQHNLGTTSYKRILATIVNFLFHDTLKSERNQFQIDHSSVATRFLHFCQSLKNSSILTDIRSFRFVTLQKARNIDSITYLQLDKSAFIIQPLIQGLHVVVFSNERETKCYNRFGELCPNLGKNIKSNISCTFEAVIVPTDEKKNPRSWRYWNFRKSMIFYVVDVFRHKDSCLLEIPFVERAKYIDVVTGKGTHAHFHRIDPALSSWESIEQRYNEDRDIFDPLIGVYLRKKDAPFHESPLQCAFPIKFLYDILGEAVVDVQSVMGTKRESLSTYHTNVEMADHKTVCVAYADDETSIHLCQYNEHVHKLCHSMTLTKMIQDVKPMVYKPESIYVVNNKATPKGVAYLRVYYDNHYNVIGYDSKSTDSRFDVPLTNKLFAHKLKLLY